MIKVLHINCSDVGSTGKIIEDISAHSQVLSVLCTPHIKKPESSIKKFKTSFPYEQGIYKRVCRIYGLRYGFAPVSTARIIHHIKKEKPQVVHFHSANMNTVNLYRVLKFLKRKNIPTVVTNHAEFFYTGSCGYAHECDRWKTGCGKCPRLTYASDSKLFDRTHTAWKKMKAAFGGFKKIQIVSVSPWVDERVKQAPIMNELPHDVITNGINTQCFSFKKDFDIHKEYNLSPDTKIIFHVTSGFSRSENHIKGGRFILALAEALKDEPVVILVAGSHEQGIKVPDNVILLGNLLNQEILAAHYATADLAILASKRETFSMPVAESLCCGTPIVGFKAGGPESIAMPEYSEFVSYGDVDALKEAVLKWLDCKKTIGAQVISEKAKELYAASVMAEKYVSVYQSLIKD
ncbi:MAG: glycosyltransferase [Clostridia bacterium]|nr:glycosyltransferase [Clostridia bacterium]